jgi:hypothetical protein
MSADVDQIEKNTKNTEVLWKGPTSMYNFALNLTKIGDVIKLLNQLPEKSSCDILNFDSKLLKCAAQIIAPCLVKLINLSIEGSIVLDDWKVARVSPIYKGKGDSDDPGTYRPISVICHIGKLVEKIILIQLLFYLEKQCSKIMILLIIGALSWLNSSDGTLLKKGETI